MNWEHLTSAEFREGLETSRGVCLLPLGVIEKHADHLPLGQDIIYIHEVATRAAREESAIVFPFYYFGQILEAKHVPGTVAIRPSLALELLENVCDEIGRNGFTKIILVNGHGGNNMMLGYFLQLQLGKEKPYMTYLSRNPGGPGTKKISEAKVDGHAGEHETCSMMYLRPELVKPDRYGTYGLPLRRHAAFREAGLATGVDWYADYPGHFAGDTVPVGPEKGEVFVKEHIESLARQIALVKRDDTPLHLYREFHLRSARPENRYP